MPQLHFDRRRTSPATAAFDPMEIQFCNNLKRKSRQGAQGVPAMQMDSSELHVPKVHKAGLAVDEWPTGNSGEHKDTTENDCLQEASCNSSDSDKTAKLRLFNICSAQQWKCPTYELCELVGSDQTMMFKYKVKVLIDTYSLTILECFSAPNCQREAAQEHAAEGALWYLNHLGYC